ncbi:MAG: lamin tail domain-containing protein [Patescibacteria group bacterium]|nr:lamin tail domain-containing protein [Patescibacteria group bacterium]
MPLRQFGLVIFFLSFFPSLVGVFNPLSVVINEIAWMGTETSYNDEWIELYNNSNSIVNLDGWKLITEDGALEINLKGEIPEKGFFILERTDDKTVLSIKADLIYKGGLNNKGEHLRLVDKDKKIIDEVNCAAGWFAGDNKTKQTMERKNSLVFGNSPENWQTSQNPGGTPKTENSVVSSHPPQETQAKKKSEPQQEFEEKELEPIIYPKNIFINEIMPSPEGPDIENEWIEIFNENGFEVDLSFWKIRDKLGATKTYSFPQGRKIAPFGFLVLLRGETKITLQNNGDGLELLNPMKEIVHKVDYQKAFLGQSYNRIDSDWLWSTTLTPGKENAITKPETQKTELLKTSEEKGDKTKISQTLQVKEAKKVLAKIGEELPQSSNHLIIFLIALAIAISSAVIVLILKKRLLGENFETEDREF